MSIRVMNWAWTTELPPTPKLVLMALADIADDQGICWPSQNTLAKKCSVAERSVRRILLQLQASKLLFVEPRFRKNGSQASNRYRLAVGCPPDNLSGALDTGGGSPRTSEVGPPGRRCPRGEDAGVLPRTTIESSFETPPPPSVADKASTAPVGCDGGDLHFPTSLTAAQRATLRSHIAVLSIEEAQLVLDELAGRMTLTKVDNPIRYTLVLVERMQAGRFVPELGPKIAEMRHAEVDHVARLAKYEHALPRETLVEARKLPAKLRASLDRMRSKSMGRSLSDGNSTPANNADGASDDHRRSQPSSAE